MIDSDNNNEFPVNDQESTPVPVSGQNSDSSEVTQMNDAPVEHVVTEAANNSSSSEPPVYQQAPNQASSQYVHASAPQPVQQSTQQARPKRTRMIIGLTALFLSVTIILTAVTAIVVYQLANRQNPAATTQAPSATTTMTSPTTGQPGTQPTTRPTTGSTTQSPAQTQPTQTTGLNTDKHFNIADAATKTSGDKKALSIMQIAKQAKPAVVAISTEARISNQFGQTGIVDAAGSGFIITANGYIVTNYHVVEGAQTISVALDDGQIFKATIVGSDPRNDLSVLKIDGNNLPTVTLGKSADLEVGELAVAIGNPLGELSGTVTAGIISALDREVTIEGVTMRLLQTDAAINSGNSGGALINSFGEVIGINNAKNAGEGVEGLGFAIPVDTAKPIIESLIRYGYVQGRPKIGIGTRDITKQMAEYYKMPVGIYVSSVEANSAAAIAGIKVGDVIIKADGKETLTTDALNEAKTFHKVGDSMSITLVREGQEITVQMVLKEDLPTNVKPASYNGSSGQII